MGPDIFFDLEGDPFVGDGGLEYLFGYAFKDAEGVLTYVADWCLTPADEKAAFERFVDFVIERRAHHPGMHIYHYAAYEVGALKRLMGRYATREEEIDTLLRGQVLVDLYAVVRHAIRASVESYSIKKLEPLYEFARAVSLSDANYSLSRVQARLELGDAGGINADDRAVVTGYNQDDCVSTGRLRDWLEGLWTGAVASGVEIARPGLPEEEAPPDITAWQARIDAVVTKLTDGIPVDAAERSVEQQAVYVLANVLDWHRREEKAIWWEYFRLAALSADELEDERAGIAGLEFVDTVGGTAKAPIHRYRFPQQDAEFRGGGDLRSVGGERFGKVEAVDLEHRYIDVKKRGDTAGFHPEAIFAHTYIDTAVLAESLVHIGEYVADHGIGGPGAYKAARDLLLLRRPMQAARRCASQARARSMRPAASSRPCRACSPSRDRLARARPIPAPTRSLRSSGLAFALG
ncbi:TM0106 family RecB-like putative nuclease [Mesorhizobium sp. M4B.F.Ca.ET.019.03.1.1]|uniref:TM0106 family RecB-like putative nuclease n=1 Tax=Mesorhizobium sp. M4B.F.Ca.ET.019.03.1.1 TaxID=2496651 RepID=UPI0032AFDA13